jgi:hypothetical protein
MIEDEDGVVSLGGEEGGEEGRWRAFTSLLQLS